PEERWDRTHSSRVSRSAIGFDEAQLACRRLVLDRLRAVEIEALDLRQRAPGDALHIAPHAGRRLHDHLDLLLALGPGLLHGLALSFKVGLHVLELLDDSLDAMPEARPREI